MYDSSIESALFVHVNYDQLKFFSSEVSYYYKLDLNNDTIMSQRFNDSFYTNWMIAHTKRGREPMHTLRCPSVENLKP